MDNKKRFKKKEFDVVFEGLSETDEVYIKDLLETTANRFDNYDAFVEALQIGAITVPNNAFSKWYSNAESKGMNAELSNFLKSVFIDARFDKQTAERIKNAQINGVTMTKFEDFATDEDKAIAKQVADWDISDQDLFE